MPYLYVHWILQLSSYKRYKKMEKQAYENWKISVISTNKQEKTGVVLFFLLWCVLYYAIIIHNSDPDIIILFFLGSTPQGKEASHTQFHEEVSQLNCIRSFIIRLWWVGATRIRDGTKDILLFWWWHIVEWVYKFYYVISLVLWYVVTMWNGSLNLGRQI